MAEITHLPMKRDGEHRRMAQRAAERAERQRAEPERKRTRDTVKKEKKNQRQ